MKISFSPVRTAAQLTLATRGDSVIINGEEFDFTPLQDGATLPASAISSTWFVGDVTRKDGELCLNLALPHGAKAPQETLFPLPISVDQDGPVATPPYEV